MKEKKDKKVTQLEEEILELNKKIEVDAIIPKFISEEGTDR